MYIGISDRFDNAGSKRNPLWVEKKLPPFIEAHLSKLRELNRSHKLRGRLLFDKKYSMWVVSSRKPFPHLPEELKRNMYEVYLPPWRDNPWVKHGGYSVYRIPLRDLVAS